MRTLTVRDWGKLQHYKDRKPTWIKLQCDIFQEYDFSCYQDASKLLAICIMTLASRYGNATDGSVPYDFEFIKRQCNLGDMVQECHLKELIDKSFLLASDVLATCYQSASPETETETEIYNITNVISYNSVNDVQDVDKPVDNLVKPQKQKKEPKEQMPEVPDYVDKIKWDGYLQMRKTIRSPVTPYIAVLLINKLKKFYQSGHDIAEIMDTATISSWKTFYEPKPTTQQGNYQNDGQYSAKPTAYTNKAQSWRDAEARILAKYAVPASGESTSH